MATARLGPGAQTGTALARDGVITTLNNLLFKRRLKYTLVLVEHTEAFFVYTAGEHKSKFRSFRQTFQRKCEEGGDYHATQVRGRGLIITQHKGEEGDDYHVTQVRGRGLIMTRHK
jgi:hypothetical protein